ncbi:MAG: adenylate/guanylate cyclase domain-containing protein [Desulfobacterales bacterium]|nr:adenylate/guanylate cyclase domain-containing protein [Desulfobacterales bacterium]
MEENHASRSTPICQSCHQPNPPGANFCQNCGSRLQQICADCGTAISANAKFCHQCGKPTEIANNRRQTIRAYTPKHLADKILTSRSALQGEHKQVTVLFADVQGSMELAEQVDPEEWHAILDDFFRILAAGIHRFEGTVNQYTGDGVMALFGAPIAHEDHALRACYAALYLRGELRRLADRMRMKRGLNFGVRIGLNSGDVVVGKIGDDLRMDYTAQGQTVGLAARMEQLAESGRIYITEHTHRLIEGFFKVRNLGASTVKGVRQPLHIYELEDIRQFQSRLDISRERGFSRFISRGAELAVLESAFQQALNGRGNVVGVVGEPGVGKSRLCHEFLELNQNKRVTICKTNCASHIRTVPLLPIQHLVRSLLGISEQDSEEETRKKIAGSLILLDEAFTDSLSVWFEFLAVKDVRLPEKEVDLDVRQQQLFALIKRLLRLKSEREPLLILVDDLHWIDLPSDAFIEQLVNSVKHTCTLIILNFRPEYRRRWMDRSVYRNLPLPALNNECAREFVDELLGKDPSAQSLAQKIVSRTAGNPFFIEELVRTLVEGGNLSGQRGAYRLENPVKTQTLPRTVQTVLAARIDRLGEKAKLVLQTASVIGQEFEKRVLHVALDLPEIELDDCLGGLIEVEFVYEKEFYPELIYAFQHPIVMEVAYRSLLSRPRADMHRRIANSFETIRSGQQDEIAGLLASHWEKGGELLKAAQWHRRAARVAGFAEVQRTFFHWNQALKLARLAPVDEEALRLQLEACCGALDIGGRVDVSPRQVKEIFNIGRELADKFGDYHSSLRLHEDMAARLGWSGDFKGQQRYLDLATTIAGKVPDPEIKLRLLQRRYVAQFHQGNLRSALTLIEEGIAGCESATPILSQSTADRLLRSFLLAGANIRSMLGELRQAADLIDQAARLAPSTDQLRKDSRTMHTEALVRASLAIYSGDVDLSLSNARAFVELAERSGSTWAIAVSASTLGRAQLVANHWMQGKESLDFALAQARKHKLGLEAEASYLAYLAEALTGIGELEQAQSVAEEAVEVARRKETRFWELQSQITLAKVFLALNHAQYHTRIVAALERAEKLIETTGGEVMRPVVLECRAELAEKLGNTGENHNMLQESLRLYQTMGAYGHAERLQKMNIEY